MRRFLVGLALVFVACGTTADPHTGVVVWKDRDLDDGGLLRSSDDDFYLGVDYGIGPVVEWVTRPEFMACSVGDFATRRGGWDAQTTCHKATTEQEKR